MRIAHLSDLHLYVPGSVRAVDLLTRRAAGALNLLYRRSLHQVDVVRAAVRAVLEADVDHVVITGDLSNLALEPEFQLAEEVLAPLGGGDRLSVIPGNHDWYTYGAVRRRRFESHFSSLIRADGKPGAVVYPVVKDFPGVRLVLVRSAIIPPPLLSFGRVGDSQIQKIRAATEAGHEEGRVVIVALHHNLHRRGMVNETIGRLLDRSRVREGLAASAVDVVLTGHDHKPKEFVIPHADGGGAVRVLACGSTSLDAPEHGRAGRFNILDLADGRLTVERWQYRHPEKRFVPEAG